MSAISATGPGSPSAARPRARAATATACAGQSSAAWSEGNAEQAAIILAAEREAGQALAARAILRRPRARRRAIPASPPVCAGLPASRYSAARTCSGFSTLGRKTAASGACAAALRSSDSSSAEELTRTITVAPQRGEAPRRLRQPRARRRLLCRRHRVLEVEQQRVRAAPVRLIDEALVGQRHEKRRTQVLKGRSGRVHAPDGTWWAVLGSNQWPLLCESSALPLS